MSDRDEDLFFMHQGIRGPSTPPTYSVPSSPSSPGSPLPSWLEDSGSPESSSVSWTAHNITTDSETFDQYFKRPRLDTKPSCRNAASQTKGGLNMDKLAKGFRGQLESGQFSDVAFNIRGKEFKVHKCIIAAHSPVFHAMWTHNMEEKESGIIKLEDIEPDVFAELLNFMYTGSVKNVTSENVVDIYTAADKYEILELCFLCVDYMIGNVSEENFCELMTLSLQYKEVSLQKAATNYFLNHYSVIMKTPAWLLFMKDSTEAANGLIINVVEKLERSKQ